MPLTAWTNAFMSMVSDVLLALLGFLSFALIVVFAGFIIWCVRGVVKNRLMYKRGFTAIIVIGIALLSGACNGSAMPTAPTSEIGLPGGGPLDAAPALFSGDFKTAMSLKAAEKEWGACFTAQEGKSPYNWELILNQPEGVYGDGLLVPMGAKACFRPNVPTRFTLKLRDSAGASLTRGGAFN